MMVGSFGDYIINTHGEESLGENCTEHCGFDIALAKPNVETYTPYPDFRNVSGVGLFLMQEYTGQENRRNK